MDRQELEEMTKVQLAEHAEVAGIKLGALDTKGTMIDKILGDYVSPAKEGKKQEEKLSPLGRLCTIDGIPISGRKYKVTIFATESDKSDVPLIVNGHNIIVKRGHEVIIDEAYVEVLRNAVIDTVVQDPDTGDRVAQRMMCYPHSAIAI